MGYGAPWPALAKAFFYAGARSILVSHWSVASVATVKLVTGTFDELKNDPTIGRAVALRRAEMAMLDPKNPPEFAHPLSGRRSCSLAKVAREGKIDRSEMAIRGISAGGLRRLRSFDKRPVTAQPNRSSAVWRRSATCGKGGRCSKRAACLSARWKVTMIRVGFGPKGWA